MRTKTADVFYYSCGCACCLGLSADDVSIGFLTLCLIGAINGLSYFLIGGTE